MKRFCLSVFAVASMLLAASCQQELNPVTDGDTTVTFTVNAGDVATRAIADGTNVDALHWEIYKTDDLATAVQPLGEKTIIDKDGNKEFTVELKLLADQKYTIIFWAEVDGAGHYNTADLRNVVINDYSNEKANDESRAAFFRVYPFETENGETITETIELYRPFSQINLGSTTYETSFNNVNGGNVKVETSEMTVTHIATSFNTLTGKGEGEQVVTFKANATPNAPADDTQKLLEVNDLYYYWIGMNYLIVCGDSDNVDVDITLDTNFGEVKHTISSVPVKENYRTNLLGNFLTTGATFNVIVDERFVNSETGELNPDIVVGVWDGVQTEEPSIVDGYYEIYTAAQWAWLKGKNLNDNNIRLMSNIDFGGHEIKGLGFKGEFDGNNFTMSNFVALPGGSAYSNGLFQGDASGEVTVKDLTVKNAVSKCSDPSYGYAGVLFGDIQYNVTLENVHIYNAEVEGVQSVGGLVGFVASGKKLTLKNCSVNDSELSNIPVVNESGFVAGLAGRVVGTVDFDADTKVKNVTIDAFYAERRGESSIQPTVAYNDNSITAQAAYTNVKITKHALSNTQETIDTQAEFEAALAEGGLILLGKLAQTKADDAAYTWKNTAKDVDIVAAEEGVAINFGTGALNGAGGAKNISFTGLVMNFQNIDYTGFHHVGKETYKDCIINGCVWTYAPVAVFDGCTLNQTGDAYNVRIYGAAEVSINNCDFTSYCKSILIYSESANEYDVTIDNSTFYAENNDGKAAVQMHTEYGVHGILRFNNTTVSGNYADINGGLYNEIDKSTGTATENFTVIIDGIEYIAEGLGKDSVKKEYYVSSAEGLVALSGISIKGGEKVLLTADIDLTGVEFAGLKAFNPENNNTFDGQGHTVSGLQMINDQISDYAFIKSWVGLIKNLNFDNCNVKGYGRNAIVAANTYTSIENVHVSNSSVESTFWSAGIIAGHFNSGNIKNCSATNCSVKSNGGTGIIVGVLNESAGTRIFEDCKVAGCTVNNTGVYGEDYCGAFVCGVININDSTVKFIGCELSDNKKEGQYVGDLYYYAGEDITVVVEE